MGAVLQICPFSIVRQAGAHLARFKPRIAASLAAIGANVARRTFIAMRWLRLVDRPLEDLPSLGHAPGSEIVPRNWERGAEIHFPIGSNGEAVSTAGTFDEIFSGGTALFKWCRAPACKHVPVDTDFRLRRQTISERRQVTGDGRGEIETVLELEP